MNTTAGIGTPYWFEWEVGLLKCLEMLQNDNIESVILQSSNFSCLDDVVVNEKDGITNIQVKHSDIGTRFSYSDLLSGDNSLIKKLATEWQQKKDKFNIKKINIATNRLWGNKKADGCCSFDDFIKKVLVEWKKDAEYNPKDASQKNAIKRIKTELSFLNNDLHCFIEKLCFLQLDNRDVLQKKIREKIVEIIGDDRDAVINMVENNLASSLRIWTTSAREKEEINREDIYKAICDNQIQLPQYDVYSEKPIFPSRKRFAEKFISSIKKTTKKNIFLHGLPGSGKTNFVSYLSELPDSLVDFRFYTYLPIKKNETYFSDDSGYYSSEYLWTCLLYQLQKKFAELGILYEIKFPLCYSYMSNQQKRNAVLKYLGIYSQCIKREIYVFIDGIDHAARAAEKGNSTFLDSLPQGEEIHSNVKFVFVGQPLHDKYPTWIRCESDTLDILELPSIEKDDVALLLETNMSNLNGINIDILSESIMDVVGNNALNVFFAIFELKKVDKDKCTFENYIKILREKKLDHQIANYYEWIYKSCGSELVIKKITALFAFLSKKATCEEIGTLLKLNLIELKYYCDKFFPLIQEVDGYYFCYHNDVRLFFLNQLADNTFSSDFIIDLYNVIKQSDRLKEISYYFLFDALLAFNKTNELYELYTPNYIVKSLQYSIPIKVLETQLKALFNDYIRNQRIEKTVEITSVLETYGQLINCISYNEKEKLFIDINEKLRSEKYSLNRDSEIKQIIDDVYFLIQNNLFDRGEKIYNEYLKDITLSNYCSYLKDEKNRDGRIKKVGAICREYNRTILDDVEKNDDQELSFFHVLFTSGWLAQSYKKQRKEEIKTSLSFKQYDPKDFRIYIIQIIKNLDLESINYLQTLMIRNSIFSALIDIGVEKKFRGIDDKALEGYLYEKKELLLTDPAFEFEHDRIPYFFKLLFCLSGKQSDNAYDSLFFTILDRLRIKKQDRGYLPANVLYQYAKEIFTWFNKLQNSYQEMEERILSLVYFENNHGSGSSYDCNATEIKRFLLTVLVKTVEKENNINSIIKIAEVTAEYAFMGQIPKYYTELIDLYYICAETKGMAMKIFDYWSGDEGIIWEREYNEVEYVCDHIIEILRNTKEPDKANILEKRKKLKLIGYVGRKDYSMADILNWYNLLSNSQKKFHEGVKLLTLSDYACELGDNRYNNSISEAIFDVAIDLGPYFVDGLFDLKNTPDDFYNWRQLFVAEYLKYIETNNLSDKELIALYNIICAWEKPEIEKHRRLYSENVDDIIENNKYMIVSRIKDDTIREEYQKKISIGETKENETITNNTGSSNHSHTPNTVAKRLEEQITKSGLDPIGEKMLAMFLSSENESDCRRVLEKLNDIIQEDERLLFVQKYILPFIKQNMKYGLRGGGYYALLENNYKYITLDEYLELMQLSFTRIEEGPDWVYSVVDDVEKLSLWLYKNTPFDDLYSIFAKKLNMHSTWITSCSEFKLNFYKINYDSNIKNLEDFCKKYIVAH